MDNRQFRLFLIINYPKAIDIDLLISYYKLLFNCSHVGLYGASHGVTANVVYDNEKRKLIKYSRELFTLRQNVTPIWTLNELAGKHSAVSMWSAGEFDFRGVKSTYYEPFNRTVHWKPRIDNIIPLLKRNESQVDFVMFYSEHPDYEDHEFAPESPQVSC